MAVRQVYEAIAVAFRKGDVNTIMSFYGPEDVVIAYDYTPPLQFRGKTGYRKSYEDFFAQTQGPIELSYRDMRVVAGRDVAFIHALERIAWTSKSGAKSELWGRCTSGLEKISGRWLIVHDHCSVPADFDTGKAAMDLKP